MSVARAVALLLFLNNLWTLPGADVPVSCPFNKTCLLPCSFTPGNAALIHWHQLTGEAELVVHSYYDDKDQLGLQNPRFKSRTSLFSNVVSTGNASLQLTQLQIRDEGRYRCYTSTTTGGTMETFIRLIVDAPVTEVDMRLVGDRITCSSEGLYPRPQLFWSNMTVQGEAQVQETPEQLFDISSSVTLTDGNKDLPHFSCRVTTGSSSWTTTLFRTTEVSIAGSKTTLECVDSDPPTTSHPVRVWKFNHSQIILEQASGSSSVSQEWRRFVTEDLSNPGTLTLQQLSSSQTGVFTCELSHTEQTKIFSTLVTIERGKGSEPDEPISLWGIVLIVAINVVLLIFVVKTAYTHRKTLRACVQRVRNRLRRGNQENEDDNEGSEVTKEKNTVV